jgi:hypothetical protein
MRVVSDSWKSSSSIPWKIEWQGGQKERSSDDFGIGKEGQGGGTKERVRRMPPHPFTQRLCSKPKRGTSGGLDRAKPLKPGSSGTHARFPRKLFQAQCGKMTTVIKNKAGTTGKRRKNLK